MTDSSVSTAGHTLLGFSADESLTFTCAQSTVGGRDVTQPGTTLALWLLKRQSLKGCRRIVYLSLGLVQLSIMYKITHVPM